MCSVSPKSDSANKEEPIVVMAHLYDDQEEQATPQSDLQTQLKESFIKEYNKTLPQQVHRSSFQNQITQPPTKKKQSVMLLRQNSKTSNINTAAHLHK